MNILNYTFFIPDYELGIDASQLQGLPSGGAQHAGEYGECLPAGR